MNSKNFQIEELLKIQPGLAYHNGIIEGKIFVKLNYNGFYVDNTYIIKIIIEEDSPFNSKVYETQGKIEKNYKHKYIDGRLCLSAPLELKIAEANDCSFVVFYNNFIAPYFFSYEYFIRFGDYPFGDREHGLIGILASYCDVTGIDDNFKMFEIIRNIHTGNYKYRGHSLCPCGSSKKTRNCHPNIICLFKNKSIIEQIDADYDLILGELNEYKRKAK